MEFYKNIKKRLFWIKKFCYTDSVNNYKSDIFTDFIR